MTLKKYQQIRLLITVFTAAIFSQALVLRNFLIPLAVIIISSLLLLILRRRVKEVIADERDYLLAGKAASLAIQIYSWLAVLIMFFLYANRTLNPYYEAIAMTLAYSTCFLMIVYSLIFKFKNKIEFSKNKRTFLTFIIILTIFIAIFTVRFFSGEDNWLCQKGEWVKHGQPSFPAPNEICK